MLQLHHRYVHIIDIQYSRNCYISEDELLSQVYDSIMGQDNITASAADGTPDKGREITYIYEYQI